MNSPNRQEIIQIASYSESLINRSVVDNVHLDFCARALEVDPGVVPGTAPAGMVALIPDLLLEGISS